MFIEFEKGFDSVEHWTIKSSMMNNRMHRFIEQYIQGSLNNN